MLTGQGATPEYAIEYLLDKSGVTDCELEFYSDPTEIAARLADDPTGVALLPQLPVDFTGEIQLRRKIKAVCRHKARAHRCKAVQTFAAEPLLMPHLNAPCTDIVHNGVAEHIGSRFLRPGTLNIFPHDECHFHFVVQIGDNVKVSVDAVPPEQLPR